MNFRFVALFIAIYLIKKLDALTCSRKTEIKSSSLFITKSYYLENLLSDFLNL